MFRSIEDEDNSEYGKVISRMIDEGVKSLIVEGVGSQLVVAMRTTIFPIEWMVRILHKILKCSTKYKIDKLIFSVVNRVTSELQILNSDIATLAIVLIVCIFNGMTASLGGMPTVIDASLTMRVFFEEEYFSQFRGYRAVTEVLAAI